MSLSETYNSWPKTTKIDKINSKLMFPFINDEMKKYHKNRDITSLSFPNYLSLRNLEHL